MQTEQRYLSKSFSNFKYYQAHAHSSGLLFWPVTTAGGVDVGASSEISNLWRARESASRRGVPAAGLWKPRLVLRQQSRTIGV